MGILLQDTPHTDYTSWGTEFSTIFGDGYAAL
jgi:hypothetical protein